MPTTGDPSRTGGKISNRGCAGQQVVQKSEALSPKVAKNGVYTGNDAAWAIESDVPRDRSTDNRNRRGDTLNCPLDQSGGASRGNNGYLTADEVGRKSRQSIVLRIRPPVLDRHVPSFDIASSIQSPAKRRQHVAIGFGIPGAEPPNHRHRRLLPPTYHGPRRRTSDPCNECSPSHLRPPETLQQPIADNGPLEREQPQPVASRRRLWRTYAVPSQTGPTDIYLNFLDNLRNGRG
jgi:hypothetical protein